MDKALIVSGSEKEANALAVFLKRFGYTDSKLFKSGTKAMQRLQSENFSIIIVSSPLEDDFGYDFAVNCSKICGSGIIFLCKANLSAGLSEKLARYGIMLVTKPLNASRFSEVISIAEVVYERTLALQRENAELKKKLANLKSENLAKCLLIEKEHMTEEKAHNFLEQIAMKERKTKLEISNEIIEKYT